MRVVRKHRRSGSLRLLDSVLLEPLQHFSHRDLAMPWILVEIVAFPWKNQKGMWNAPRLKCALEQIVFEERNGRVFGTGNDVRGCRNLTNLPNSGFGLIVLLR